MSLRTVLAFVIGGSLCLACSGCSFYTPPRLEVEGVQLVEESEEGLVLEFEVAADNLNERALPLEQVEYSLSLEGRRVFSGVRSPEATLRRIGTQRLYLPAVLNLNEVDRPSGVVPYRLSGTLKYRTPGEIQEILYDSRVWRPSVGFSSSGQIDFDAVEVAPAPAMEELTRR